MVRLGLPIQRSNGYFHWTVRPVCQHILCSGTLDAARKELSHRSNVQSLRPSIWITHTFTEQNERL